MATLNQIAYNIKELMSGGDTNIENNISTRQIKHWIHYHRAKIIEEKILNNYPIDRRWIQPIRACAILPSSYGSYFFSQSWQISAQNNPSINMEEQSAWSSNNYYGKNYLDDNDNMYFLYTKEIPSTINVGSRDGITDARIKRRVRNPYNEIFGQFTGWSPVPVKTKDESQYAWANKFTKIKTPYVIPYNENHATKLEVGGLRIRPDRTTNDNIYEYGLEIYGILQNPQDSIRWNWDQDTTTGILEIEETHYNDTDDEYPISNEDLPLLMSRVAEVEMTLLLQTPSDLVEDNVDTSKIKVGGSQQQQKRRR